ncbi:MAG: Minf_1886 family protein [Planctomycetota bacterium]
MPPPKPVELDLKQLQAAAGAYPREAFEFVQRGLSATADRVHAADVGGPGGGHVTGQQLCLGLADLAIDQYGLMARSVLENWNIHRTDDFGRIVFGLIECGLMSKTPQDSMEDFRSVFEFDETFHHAQVAQRIALHAGRTTAD